MNRALSGFNCFLVILSKLVYDIRERKLKYVSSRQTLTAKPQILYLCYYGEIISMRTREKYLVSPPCGSNLTVGTMG